MVRAGTRYVTNRVPSTIRILGLRVALHELGRVLGLGGLVDGWHLRVRFLRNLLMSDFHPFIG